MGRPTKAKRTRPRKPRATAAKSVVKPAAKPVTVVGIGASAGGLEALEQFLRAVPARSGLAYVIVQHLDPNHRANVFVELLQRASSLPIVQAKHDMQIVADHIYVTPPNNNLVVAGDVLQLTPLAEARSVRLPIDVLFRSLAEDRRERAIGVILSGMGSDGTLGLRAIKENAGVAFVQAVGSAKVHGMPQSAIEAGLADVVAPADQVPAQI